MHCCFWEKLQGILVSTPIRNYPGYSLRRASTAAMTDLSERLASEDLRITDATILVLIDEETRLTASQIGKMLDIQRANMVPFLARIEAVGLIAREPIDKKSIALVLTGAGRKKLERVRAIIERFEAELIARVPEEHRAHLKPALDALWR